MALDELVGFISRKESLPRKAIAITFDDGYKDNYLYAYPILKKYNVPATVFLTTGYIDNPELFWWDKVRYIVQHTALETLELDGQIYSLRSTSERLRAGSAIESTLKEMYEEQRNSSIERLVSISGINASPDLGKELVLSWDEAKEMSKNGIAFGAHTVTHPILTQLPLDKAKREIVESKLRIEEKLGQAATAFSYPNGRATDFNNDIKEIVRENGFTCAVTAVPTSVNPGADLYELGRFPPEQNLATTKFAVCGLYSDLKTVLGCMERR